MNRIGHICSVPGVWARKTLAGLEAQGTRAQASMLAVQRIRCLSAATRSDCPLPRRRDCNLLVVWIDFDLQQEVLGTESRSGYRSTLPNLSWKPTWI